MPDQNIPEITPDFAARLVMLVFGRMSNGLPFWCFVAVKPSRYKELKAKVKDKTLDLRTYVDDGFGEIVVSGESATPPVDVIKTIAKMFNVPIKQLFYDFNIDETINKEIERLKKELGVS